MAGMLAADIGLMLRFAEAAHEKRGFIPTVTRRIGIAASFSFDLGV